jgi:hypothetical protein
LLVALEAAPTGVGRFDDLRFVAFTVREWRTVLRLDSIRVIGSLLRFARRHSPHHLSPARANHPAGHSPKARLNGSQFLQQCSVCSAMPAHFEQHDCSFAGSIELSAASLSCNGRREFIYSCYHGFRIRMVRHVPNAVENYQLGTR